jgi:hypothetical protein
LVTACFWANKNVLLINKKAARIKSLFFCDFITLKIKIIGLKKLTCSENGQFKQYFNRRFQMLINGKNTGVILLMLAFLSCGTTKVAVNGKVQRVMGNQMPSPDLKNEEPAGFAATVFFFEPTLMNMGVPTGEQGLFLMTNKKLVAKVLCESDGSFSLKIKPGKYSVLLGKDGQYYSNISSLDGLINPIDINKKENKTIVLRADWGATY